MGILAALSMSAVSRLKFTLAGVKKKLQSAVTEMKTIFEATGSWKNYRKLLQESVGPVVPYLYVHPIIFYHNSKMIFLFLKY
jgi:hypothetical protein